ncbi:MAG: phosphate uptake regulator PhoU [Thaumarchaeota archaeon]|nr:phosphate uptake regulator PhoU [Nitrososphaerota archaeon]
MEIRKAQRAGYSTLVVSLPIKWVKEAGVKPGDSLALVEEQDGSLRVMPQLGLKKTAESLCVVNADLCTENLLTKILIGEYMVGHEIIQVVSKRPLKPEQLLEIRDATSKLIGMGVVEQTLNRITLQSLVDPAKFPIYASIRRLHLIIIAMFEAILHAIAEREAKYLKEVGNMENDVDRLYKLIVRQLILAAKDREMMKQVEVETPLNILGNRVVAKALEEVSDLAHSIAANMLSSLIEKDNDSTLKKASPLISKTKVVAESALEAFLKKDAVAAGKASLDADNVIKECKDAETMSLKTLPWNLAQAIKQYKTIAEITVNRALEESSEISRKIEGNDTATL